MNKAEIETEIIEMSRLCGALVEEIQWDQSIEKDQMKSILFEMQTRIAKLIELLG